MNALIHRFRDGFAQGYGERRYPSDNPAWQAYVEAVKRGETIIRLTLDVAQPVELSEFVGAFTALASEYDRYLREVAPGRNDATMYVKQVREGSLVALIIPTLMATGGAILAGMVAYNAADEFVERAGRRLGRYLQPGGRVEGATKAELRDFTEQIAAIASIPNSRLEVAAIRVENGDEVVTAAFRFNTSEAREIQQRVAEHKQELDHTSRADRERVLMTFVRSDKRDAPQGKRSGELVEIETISARPLPLIYASSLAEDQIKHEITSDDSVYKKGFWVDVNVETRGGKPVAYAVTNLHNVIDLPDDED